VDYASLRLLVPSDEKVKFDTNMLSVDGGRISRVRREIRIGIPVRDPRWNPNADLSQFYSTAASCLAPKQCRTQPRLLTLQIHTGEG
jgi:hypothetical protein